MLVAHTGDNHLGYKRFLALAANGRNAREFDCALAWRAFVDGAIARGVSLALIGGDLFDIGRVSMLTAADVFRGVQRLVRARIPTLVIAGNHDLKGIAVSGGSGREYTGTPLIAAQLAGAKVVLSAEYVRIPALDTTVLMVPDEDVRRVKLVPSSDSGTQLLLAHGKFDAALYRLPESECIDPAAIHPDFRYAALNDFHVFSQVAPNAFYSGATEWCSSNIWGELAGPPKGWNCFDTETGTLERVLVPTRPHFDLPVIDANGLTGKQITDQILANISAIDATDAVVRQVVADCHPVTKKDIDHRALKAITHAMLAWYPDIRRPDYDEFRERLGLELPEGAHPMDRINDDEPVEQFDAVTDAQVNAWLADPSALERLAAENTDPYGLDAPAPKMRARERAA